MFVQILYSLPACILLPLLWFFYISYALIGGYIVERLMKNKLFVIDNGALGPMGGLINTMFAILGAFVAVSALTTYRNIESLVQNEAAIVSAIYHSASGLPADSRNEIQSNIINYAEKAVNGEWPNMRNEKLDLSAKIYLEDILQESNKYIINSSIDNTLFTKIIDQIFSLYEIHRQRADSINKSLETTTWVVLLLISVVAISLNFFYAMKSRYIRYIALASISLVVASLVFLIILYDHPYRGEVSIRPTPLKEVLEHITSQHL